MYPKPHKPGKRQFKVPEIDDGYEVNIVQVEKSAAA